MNIVDPETGETTTRYFYLDKVSPELTKEYACFLIKSAEETEGPATWQKASSEELKKIRDELKEQEKTFPKDPFQRYLALAKFYKKHQLYLQAVAALDEARVANPNKSNLDVTYDLIETLRVAGFSKAAEATLKYEEGKAKPNEDKP